MHESLHDFVAKLRTNVVKYADYDKKMSMKLFCSSWTSRLRQAWFTKKAWWLTSQRWKSHWSNELRYRSWFDARWQSAWFSQFRIAFVMQRSSSKSCTCKTLDRKTHALQPNQFNKQRSSQTEINKSMIMNSNENFNRPRYLVVQAHLRKTKGSAVVYLYN